MKDNSAVQQFSHQLFHLVEEHPELTLAEIVGCLELVKADHIDAMRKEYDGESK